MPAMFFGPSAPWPTPPSSSAVRSTRPSPPTGSTGLGARGLRAMLESNGGADRVYEYAEPAARGSTRPPCTAASPRSSRSAGRRRDEPRSGVVDTVRRPGTRREARPGHHHLAGERLRPDRGLSPHVDVASFDVVVDSSQVSSAQARRGGVRLRPGALGERRPAPSRWRTTSGACRRRRRWACLRGLPQREHRRPRLRAAPSVASTARASDGRPPSRPRRARW